MQTKTLSVRVKDKYAVALRQMTPEVSQGYNRVTEITRAASSNAGASGALRTQWLSVCNIQKLTAGIQKERGFSVGSATVQDVSAHHGKVRKHDRNVNATNNIPEAGYRLPVAACRQGGYQELTQCL